MRIEKLIEKQNNCYQILVGEICSGLLQVKHKKAIKWKQIHNDKKLWINKNSWSVFIMNANFKFTCMLSCVLIMRKWQWRTNLLLLTHLLWTTTKYQPQYQSQNIVLDLVTYVQKSMIYIITLMIQN